MKGLRIHCSKIHGVSNIAVNSENKNGNQEDEENQIFHIAKYKSTIYLLKRIPKGARILAANKFASVVEECVSKNDFHSWENLLLFSYKTLFNPNRKDDSRLVSSVKKNISSFTIPSGKKQKGCTRKRYDNEEEFMLRIESKVSDFDIRGAVKLLTSNDSIAIEDETTLNELKKKHPKPSRPLKIPEKQSDPQIHLNVSEKQVKKSILSFKNGSAGGIDGFYPQYMKDMISKHTGDEGVKALKSLTKLINLILRGEVDDRICQFLYGASLCALEKKRWRYSSYCNKKFHQEISLKACLPTCPKNMGEYLRPHQLGFATNLVHL